MAKKVIQAETYEYIAHVQKEDGTVIELAGSRYDLTHNLVYKWLLMRASELGGWLISQRISESDVNAVVVATPKVAASSYVGVTVPTVFENTSVFGEYKRTYKGAMPITFKDRSTL